MGGSHFGSSSSSMVHLVLKEGSPSRGLGAVGTSRTSNIMVHFSDVAVVYHTSSIPLK